MIRENVNNILRDRANFHKVFHRLFEDFTHPGGTG